MNLEWEGLISFLKLITEEMNRRIGPGHEKLKEFIIPNWAPGCRRISPGDGYLEALVKPNVNPVYGGIQKIVPEGIVTEDGELHKMDILVCATGFNVAFRPAFKLINGTGDTLVEDWGDSVNLYLGVSAPRFPNYYTIVVSKLYSVQVSRLTLGLLGSWRDVVIWHIASLNRDDDRICCENNEEDTARKHSVA